MDYSIESTKLAASTFDPSTRTAVPPISRPLAAFQPSTGASRFRLRLNRNRGTPLISTFFFPIRLPFFIWDPPTQLVSFDDQLFTTKPGPNHFAQKSKLHPVSLSVSLVETMLFGRMLQIRLLFLLYLVRRGGPHF